MTYGISELEVLVAAAHGAGALVADAHRKRRVSIERKTEGPASLVTNADYAADDYLHTSLQRAFPGLSIVSEERDGAYPGGTACIVDPLDGTLNFAHGYPEFAVSIALWDRGRPQLAVVYHPLREETYRAGRGLGAWRGTERLCGSRCGEIADALLFSGWPYDKRYAAGCAQLVGALVEVCREVRIVGSGALAPCYVAAGSADGFWELGLAPWDLAAAVLIAAEAGMAVSDLDGAPFTLTSGRVLVCPPELTEPLADYTAQLVHVHADAKPLPTDSQEEDDR